MFWDMSLAQSKIIDHILIANLTNKGAYHTIRALVINFNCI